MDGAVYLIEGKRIEAHTPGFAEAVAHAYAGHVRPRCLCLVDGTEMYVARLGEGFIVKRMPNTGSRHAPDCPSYEPPPESSGLGQVLGTAIKEDPASGETTLKLGFSMAKLGARATMPAPGSPTDSAVSDGTRLSLRGLLHYLWDQAELTRWRPGFAGKRSWGTVRRHLLLAAEGKLARGEALRSRLYIPEVFSVEQRDDLNARRIAQWRHATAAPGRPQHLMLLIAEVKEIVPARYGYKAVIKHVPDQAFALDEPLYRSLGRRFDAELALWGSSENVRMVGIATFGVSEAGVPAIVELSLMPVTQQWIPVENSFEQQLVERLVGDARSFIKGLRYNLRRDQCLTSATLTDTEDKASLLFVAPHGLNGAHTANSIRCTAPGADWSIWVWRPTSEGMPPLPQRVQRLLSGHPIGGIRRFLSYPC